MSGSAAWSEPDPGAPSLRKRARDHSVSWSSRGLPCRLLDQVDKVVTVIIDEVLKWSRARRHRALVPRGSRE